MAASWWRRRTDRLPAYGDRLSSAGSSIIPVRQSRSPAPRLRAKPCHIPDLRADAGYLEREPIVTTAVELGQIRTLVAVPLLKDERADRRVRHLPPGGAAVHRQADRAGAELRRPGRHRHREHAAAQRIAAIAGAADGDRGCAARHQLVARRPGAGVRAMLENATRICEANFGIMFALRRRPVSRGGDAQCAAGLFAEARRREPAIRPRRRAIRWRASWSPKDAAHSPICGRTKPISPASRRPSSSA